MRLVAASFGLPSPLNLSSSPDRLSLLSRLPFPSVMILPRLAALALLPLLASAAASFQNTAIVRTIELGGSISVVSTTYTAKVTSQEAATEYIVGLGKEEEGKVGWFDVREKKGSKAGGQLEWRRGRWDERRSVHAFPSPLTALKLLQGDARELKEGHRMRLLFSGCL